MTGDQTKQQKFDIQSKIAGDLMHTMKMYKVSGRDAANYLGVDEATVSRLKNKSQPGVSVQMLRSVEMMRAAIPSTLRMEAEGWAANCGMSWEEFCLCCVARVGKSVAREFGVPFNEPAKTRTNSTSPIQPAASEIASAVKVLARTARGKKLEADAPNVPSSPPSKAARKRRDGQR